MSEVLREKIKQKKAKIGIIGLGYVGLPLAIEFARKGYSVHGIDLDVSKIKLIQQKKNYIKDVINKDFLYAINNVLLEDILRAQSLERVGGGRTRFDVLKTSHEFMERVIGTYTLFSH